MAPDPGNLYNSQGNNLHFIGSGYSFDSSRNRPILVSCIGNSDKNIPAKLQDSQDSLQLISKIPNTTKKEPYSCP
jgi:hypothetical protein